jgi:GTP-binding protein HflX
LEETLVADVVLHVADASLPADRLREQIGAVGGVLSEIGGDAVPVELVLNKIDRLDRLERRRVGNQFPDAALVSAVTGEGLDDLRERVARRFQDRFEDVRLFVPYDQGRALADLYALGAPITARRDTETGVEVQARLPHRDVRRFASFVVVDASIEQASHG